MPDEEVESIGAAFITSSGVLILTNGGSITLVITF